MNKNSWNRMFGGATQKIICSSCGYAEKVTRPPHSELVDCPKCGKRSFPRRWEVHVVG